ncbi:uncharacterized protein LOC108026104 [Drosophila biarmipes]|uniref:uncharacterized protein LOC108026104 n=1 Tax=Drosophila biarmipes TaxID=125945 RepID=UPI0007E6A84E|nr:uncharacterized protein LOC108026104 [Drosophila biarmipes]
MPIGKCVVFLILFCAGCPGLAEHGEDNTSPKCANCKDIQSKCTVTKSGLFCTNKTDKLNIQFAKGRDDYTYDVDDCVPEKYTITGPIMDWCCLWSPKIGCQQVAGSHYQNQSEWENTCDICLHSCICTEDRDNGVDKASPTKWWTALGILVALSRSHPQS